MTTVGASTEPQVFELRLPALALEAGSSVDAHVVRGWWWGPEADLPVLSSRTRTVASDLPLRVVRRSAADLGRIEPIDHGSRVVRFDEGVPTIVVVHALTGDMRPGGIGGWWEPVIGPGRAIDPASSRVLCFNNLGGCYGTSGPADEGFPLRDTTPVLPAVVTPWDQARSILRALDELGIQRVHLATGGSLGGMIVLCLAALDPDRFERIAPIAAMPSASAWVIGWNHVARQALLLDPNYPEAPDRGLALAREIAMLTYRAEPGLDERQGRAMAGAAGWSPEAPYRIETYLAHQGEKLRDRFHALSYLCQLGAMDHHDLGREPGSRQAGGTWGIDRIRASTLSVTSDSDQLFFPAQMHRLAARLRERRVYVEDFAIHSSHGHDAFLIEWPQVGAMLRQAQALPGPAVPRTREVG